VSLPDNHSGRGSTPGRLTKRVLDLAVGAVSSDHQGIQPMLCLSRPLGLVWYLPVLLGHDQWPSMARGATKGLTAY
jgi:hypothetical protein